MLTHLSIRNYTLVDQLDVEINHGMTAITGETGAGKSIMLDALGLTLGDRADAARVRQGQDRADICASFDIGRLPKAQRWLQQHALEGSLEASEQECLLRRTITNEGRSRAFINGQPVTLTQLKELGEMLIDIHAQHEHQNLLHKDTQRALLDDFGAHHELVDQVKSTFQDWQHVLERFHTLKNNLEETTARAQLLSYQVDELDQLSLQPGELEQLESEQRNLADGEAILQGCYQLTALCGAEEQSLLEALSRACALAEQLPQDIPALHAAGDMLSSARIQVEEAQREIDHYVDGFQLDPERLQEVEQRLSSIYDIARKHRVKPDGLVELHQTLRQELQCLTGTDSDLDELQAKIEHLENSYRQLAIALSNRRQTAADKLAKQVNQQLKKLAMEHAKLQIALEPQVAAKAHGLEDIQILISTNPGQPPQALGKIASGGELSRVSLAIQVVTARTSTTPTLVFDEVDVGIGGATADVVGQLLRQLGESAQVLCVTHLAQVAGKAHHHLRVNKSAKGAKVAVSLEALGTEDKVAEIARMIGTNKLTQTTLDHAREMLENREVA